MMVVHSRTKRQQLLCVCVGGSHGFSFVPVIGLSSDLHHINALEETHIQLSEIASP